MIGLRDFVPPVIAKIWHRLRASKATPVEDQIFPDYESAAASCAGGWSDRKLIDAIVEDAIAVRARTFFLPATIGAVELRALAAIGWVLNDITAAPETLAVLDFGGSAGYNYFAAKALYRRQAFRWCVVETAAMVEAAAARIADDELAFIADVSSAPKPHVIFSSGALQYHPRPLQALDGLIALGAPYLVLFRTVMSDADSPFCAVQTALRSRHLHVGPQQSSEDEPIRYPLTVVTRESVRERLLRDYDIVAEIDEGVLNRIGPRAIHGFAMICRRRKAGSSAEELRYSAASQEGS